MIKVNCNCCKKEFEVDNGHYHKNLKRGYNFVCPDTCRFLPIEKRFWDKVDKKGEDDCWNWKGSCRSAFGYGAIKFGEKTIDAHRLSWMMANNKYDITPKDFVCHKCDNPKCVNPNHLFLGNATINMRDAWNKGRIKVPIGYAFKKGSIPVNKTISDGLLFQILLEYELGEVSYAQLAKLHKVSYQAIRDFRRKRNKD